MIASSSPLFKPGTVTIITAAAAGLAPIPDLCDSLVGRLRHLSLATSGAAPRLVRAVL